MTRSTEREELIRTRSRLLGALSDLCCAVGRPGQAEALARARRVLVEERGGRIPRGAQMRVSVNLDHPRADEFAAGYAAGLRDRPRR